MPPTGITLTPAPAGSTPLAVVLPAGVPADAAARLEWEAYAPPGAAGGVLVVARANADADYVGAAAPPPPADTPAPTYALARLPAAGGAGFYAALAAAAPAALTPRLTRLAYAHTAAGAATAPTPPTPADRAAARQAGKRALVEAYGSARARRKLAAADRGGVDAAAAGDGAAGVAGLLAGAAAAAGPGAGKEAVLAAIVAARPALPPHVGAATTPHAAYPIDTLVPPGGMASLDAWAAELADIKKEGRIAEAAAAAAAAAAAPRPPKNEDGTLPKPDPTIHFHPHVLDRLADLPSDVDSDAGRRRLRCLALLSAALRLAAAPRTLRVDAGAWPAVAARVAVPEAFLAALLSRYADAAPVGRGGTSFSRTGVHATAARVLAVIAAVLASDGDLPAASFAGLRSALAGPAKELASFAREAGCRADAAAAVDGHRTYRVRLLVGEAPGTALADCFPKLKVGRAKK